MTGGRARAADAIPVAAGATVWPSRPPRTTRRAIVIGGGVSGLTTAVCLAEEGWHVAVVTADDPLGTTSAVASALVGLMLTTDERLSRWTAETTAVMTALAAVDDAGIHLARGLIAERRSTVVPRAVTSLPDFAEATATDLPDDFVQGCWLSLPLVDMRRYLVYLSNRLRRAGGTMVRRRIASLDELDGDADVVANCSGLGARALVGDRTVIPTFGQHLVVENPGIDHFFLDGLVSDEEWIAWYPYPTHVIIGGAARKDCWDTSPDLDLARRLQARAARVAPSFADAAVLGHQVGLRPQRSDVRVELCRGGATPVVHNYGHGRIGVTLSWGCAREATSLMDTAVEQQR
jgi:D-amino-acid oxidase